VNERPALRSFDAAELFERAPLALSVLDLDGRQVTANRAYRRLFALGDGPITDVDALTVSHPDERETTAAYLQDLVSGDRDETQVEKRYLRLDGTGFTGRLTATRMVDENGRVTGLLGVIEDVSEQQAQRLELDLAHRRLAAMLANISDTVTLVDAEGNVLDTTGLRVEILGHPPDFWKERSIFDLVDPTDLPRLLETRDEVLRFPGRQVTIDMRVVQADGTWADIEAFTVEFPVEETDDVPDDDPVGVFRLRRDAHVLVVEDNPVNQMLVAEQLARLGARATVVGTGQDALDALHDDHDVDCVLMDWQLPGLDGVETTRRQRATEGPGAHVPIIAMTASSRPSDRSTCLAAGMDEMLVKPVGLHELGAALQPFVGERRSADRATPTGDATIAADVAALDRLAQDLGSVGPVRSIVTTFLTELDHREAAVHDAVDEGDDDLLRRTAHTLRSTSRTWGPTSSTP